MHPISIEVTELLDTLIRLEKSAGERKNARAACWFDKLTTNGSVHSCRELESAVPDCRGSYRSS